MLKEFFYIPKSVLRYHFTASGGGREGSALMISEVRKGSAAHRTGTLEAGDRILSIDGVRLDECSVDDARALLASAEDVVRLKIQKDEENSGENQKYFVICSVLDFHSRRIDFLKKMIKSSSCSPYYADTCNKWRSLFPGLDSYADQIEHSYPVHMSNLCGL